METIGGENVYICLTHETLVVDTRDADDFGLVSKLILTEINL